MTEQALTPLAPGGQLDILRGRIGEYVTASRADRTKEAYRRAFQHFATWCEGQGVASLPAAPATVAAYLATLADEGKSASTIGQRVAAIQFAHKLAGHESPTKSALVETAAAGIRRTIGTAQHGKAPVIVADLRIMLDTLPDSLRGIRDKALLLLGFAGAFRRSELVQLQVADIEECREGLKVTLRRSKTDQEGEGMVKAIPFGSNEDTCPVRAYQVWLAAAGIAEGVVFRSVSRHGTIGAPLSDKDVARAVKKAADAAGLDASKFSGHSLRAGLATSAAAAGVSERVIMQQTGHKSERMVRKYIREGNLFRENAVSAIGL